MSCGRMCPSPVVLFHAPSHMELEAEPPLGVADCPHQTMPVAYRPTQPVESQRSRRSRCAPVTTIIVRLRSARGRGGKGV
eukprot:1855399-Prymnesium_polylepis.1